MRSKRKSAKVTKVIDGDTFEIDRKIDGSNRVRIARIDTPEKGQKGAAKAREFLKKEIEGQNVVLDPKAKDTYGRVVAFVYKEGKSIGKKLRKKGY